MGNADLKEAIRRIIHYHGYKDQPDFLRHVIMNNHIVKLELKIIKHEKVQSSSKLASQNGEQSEKEK